MEEIELTAQPYNAVELNAKPAWDLSELSYMTSLPMSTLLQLLDRIPARMFLMGRRKYIFREDAVAWIEDVARNNPYSRRQNRRG